MAGAVCVLCTACGNGTATTMKLARVQGEVSVRDDNEKELTPAQDMGLYSGYCLETEKDAYSWIDLDSVKLAKMDQESEIEIEKSGKKLEIELNAGGLFFQVAKPLEEDETMDIRTSNMTVGIRGTCGWVSVPGEGEMAVYILKGTVECSITDPDTGEVLAVQSVMEGEMARLTWRDGEAGITVEEFRKEEIPDFVEVELEQDSELREHVQEILAAGGEDGDAGDESGEEAEAGKSTDEETSGIDERGSVPREPVVITSSVDGLEYVNGNGDGNVIVTLRDGLYGAVNLDGKEIVPNSYTSYILTPNNDGQFVLGDEGLAVVYDNQGNEILRLPEYNGIRLSENAVTACYINAEGEPELGCYDIGMGSYTVRIGLGYLNNPGSIGFTGRQGGEFWYSTMEDLRLRLVGEDGSILWTDEALEAECLELWKEEMRADGYTVTETEGGAYATLPNGGASDNGFYDGTQGISSFSHDPGYPLRDSKDGYMVCCPWLESSIMRVFDCNERRMIVMSTYEEDGNALPDEYEYWPKSYYTDGGWYANSKSLIVLRGTDYGEENTYMDFLIDISRAQTDASGWVTNLPEMVLAQYPEIDLTGDGYCLASDGESWFYLDEQGSRVNTPQWADCSAFYGGYALVLEEDGMAYVVDKNFQKVTEGYPADAVSLSAGLFCVRNGEEKTFIYMR